MKHKITNSKFFKLFLKSSLLVLLLNVCIWAKANHTPKGHSSQFILKNNFINPVNIIFDGIMYNNIGNNFRLPYIYAGNHQIIVETELFSGRGRYLGKRLLYKGQILAPRKSIIISSIDHYSTFRIDRIIQKQNKPYQSDHRNNPRKCNDYNCDDDDCEYDSDDYEYDYQYRNGDKRYRNDDNYKPNPSDRRNPNQQNDDNRNNNRDNENRNQNQYQNGINRLMATIKQQSFDDDKLTIAKQYISVNQIETKDLIQIIQMLSFETNKLDLAKYSYQYTIDKSNYFEVNSALMYKSSIDELDRFIKG